MTDNMQTRHPAQPKQAPAKPASHRGPPPRSGGARPPRNRRRLVLAAAVLAVLAVVDLNYRHAASYRTAAGERMTVSLDAGGMLVVNPASEVRVNLHPWVRLLQVARGEAVVEPAAGGRPLRVLTPDGEIDSANGRFEVQVAANASMVTVAEGTVTVAVRPRQAAGLPPESDRDWLDWYAAELASWRQPADPRQPGNFALAAGQQLRFGGGEPLLATVATSQPWPQGLLVFEQTPLADVVRQLGRYHAVTIELADLELQDIRVSGSFEPSDLPAILQALRTGYPVRVEWLDPGHLRLHYAAAGTGADTASPVPSRLTP